MSWCALCCVVLFSVVLSLFVLSTLVLSCGLVFSMVWSCLVLSFRICSITSTTNVLHNRLSPAEHSLSRYRRVVVTSQRNGNGGHKPTSRDDRISYHKVSLKLIFCFDRHDSNPTPPTSFTSLYSPIFKWAWQGDTAGIHGGS